MTTLTIRIDENLKKKAFNQAEKMGIPLTLVLKSALKNFIEAKSFTVGKAETIAVTPAIQKKMDKIGKLLSR